MEHDLIVLTLQKIGQINLHFAKHITNLVYGKKILAQAFTEISQLITFIQQETGVSIKIAAAAAAYDSAVEIKRKTSEHNIEILIPGHSDFPLGLKYIDKPPVLLYAKGNTALLNNSPAVAVIGAREASSYSAGFASSVAEKLVQHDYVVVSGLFPSSGPVL